MCVAPKWCQSHIKYDLAVKATVIFKKKKKSDI